MPSTFTIQGELSRGGLQAVRDQLATLLNEFLAAEGPDDGAEADSVLYEKMHALHGRMGPTTWKFVYGCAEKFEAGQDMTFADLAQVFGVGVGTVKSWHRSASKSINWVDERFGGPLVFESRWDGPRKRYSMPRETREAILALGREHDQH